MRTPVLILCLSVFVVGTAPGQDSLNVRLVGACGASSCANDVTVSGSYAFVACQDTGRLDVVSIVGPAQPVKIGSIGFQDEACGSAVRGDFVYVAADHAGLRVISISDPANPVEVGYCATPGRAMGVTLSREYAFVADEGSGLRVISVADPAHPVEVGHCDSMGLANGVTVVEDYAYVASLGGLFVVAVSDPTLPVIVGSCQLSGLGVAVSGDYAYVAGGGLIVVRIFDPFHPVEVGRVGLSCHGISLEGSRAFVAATSQGLRVISVADPAHPVELGYYDIPGPQGASGVTAVGDYAYVAYDWKGLQVFQYYGAGVEEETMSAPRKAWLVQPVRVRLEEGWQPPQ